MIREAIQFVEEFEKDAVLEKEREDWLNQKFIIINTVDENNILKYNGSEILEDEQKILEWLDKNKHYTQFLKLTIKEKTRTATLSFNCTRIEFSLIHQLPHSAGTSFPHASKSRHKFSSSTSTGVYP